MMQMSKNFEISDSGQQILDKLDATEVVSKKFTDFKV